MAARPQSERLDSPYQISEKNRERIRSSGAGQRRIYLLQFFSLELSLLIPRIFGAELTSNIYLDVGRAFTSNFISCESGEGAPTPLPHPKTPRSVKVYNGA